MNHREKKKNNINNWFLSPYTIVLVWSNELANVVGPGRCVGDIRKERRENSE